MSKSNDFGLTVAERLKKANLTIEEDEIRRFILRESPNLGRPPRIEKIISSFNTITTERVLRVLDKLEDKDIILREKGTGEIISAYPFSAILTPHRVTLRGKKEVYALCAVDALGMPFMFDMDGTIESSCFRCGKEIRVEILDEKIFYQNPHGIAVWLTSMEGCCGSIATAKCPQINFFCSKEHLEEWKSENPDEAGNPLNLEQATEVGRAIFGSVLKERSE